MGIAAPRAEARRGLSLVTILLSVTIAELVLLGSGRPLQLGPLTLRMWLYLAGLGISAVVLSQQRRLDRELTLLTLGFVALLAVSSLIGLVGGADAGLVREDVKPLLFFLSLPFFAIAVQDAREVRRAATIIRVGAVLLAVAYLLVLALVALGVIPFAALYAVMSQSDEFFFRGEAGLFYKGFVYLGIGVFFFLFERGVRAKLTSVLLVATIVLTLTRGLLLATILVAAVASAARQRHAFWAVLALAITLLVGVALWPLVAATYMDRGVSDAVRILDIQYVATHTTPLSLLGGHGFGTLIRDRARIEIVYLEILFKQGLLGLAFWALLLGLIARDYRAAARRGYGRLALPFLLGALFVYIQSATNPFVNNPIGMSMVLVALVACRRLARTSSPPVRGDGWRDLAPTTPLSRAATRA